MYKKQFENKMTNDNYIINIVKKNNPKTIDELINLIQPIYHVPKKDILERLLHLENQGKITLKNQTTTVTPVLRNYLFSTKSSWYWTIIVTALATAALVLIVPENVYPLVYARYIIGAIFVLFLPGYSFIKALFPGKELDNIERTALSVGMSIALVAITGLILNYTTWGIRTTPITLILLTLTIIFATAAIIREHRTKKQNQ